MEIERLPSANSDGTKNFPWSKKPLLTTGDESLHGYVRQPCKISGRSGRSCPKVNRVTAPFRGLPHTAGCFYAVSRMATYFLTRLGKPRSRSFPDQTYSCPILDMMKGVFPLLFFSRCSTTLKSIRISSPSRFLSPFSSALVDDSENVSSTTRLTYK